MTDPSIVAQLLLWPDSLLPPKKPEKTSRLHVAWQCPERLPGFVRTAPSVMRLLDLLGPLHWEAFPERNLQRQWCRPPIPYAALAAAELIKLNEHLPSLGHLRRYLYEHPGLIWLLGFPLAPTLHGPLGFNPLASLPSQRHFTAMLRHMPNATLQFLLNDSVELILAELAARHLLPIECVSVDTKHIIAWVKENNPKAYVSDRFNKEHQPAGDPDCRLGCKRRHNRATGATPTQNPQAAAGLKVGEYYWGYGSGLVVAKIAELGEFVLAELTQPFDHGDLSYFFPLMHQTEQRLGYSPRCGTLDAAFDAWYVYAYFYRENDPSAFAAVPFSGKGGYLHRSFSPEGLPLCDAGFPMPLRFTYTDRTSCLVEHERGKYVCPLLYPQRSRRRCPLPHAQWEHGGCTVMMPTSIGARLRYTLNRDSEAYKTLYRH